MKKGTESLNDILSQFENEFIPVSDEQSELIEKREKEILLNQRMEAKKAIAKKSGLNWKKLCNARLSLFEGFDFNPKVDYKFTGPMGTGKTFLSHAIALRYLQCGKKVLLLDKYRIVEFAYDISMNQRKISEALESVDLLILDDFGQVDLTAKQKQIWNFIIGERAEFDLRTIITGNFKIDHLLEDVTLERFRQTYVFIDFYGDSKRDTLNHEKVHIRNQKVLNSDEIQSLTLGIESEE